jgi:quinol monooxygenase YgiN
MAIFVTMQVGPVDWAKFKGAVDYYKGVAAPGLISSEVYRAQSDPAIVMVVERWESHDAMNKFQDRVGEDFNARAGTTGMEWQTGVWELP